MADGGLCSDACEPAHPDGRPWRKACPECAFRRTNPQQLSDDDFDWMYLQEMFGGFSFTCAHRTDDGFYRECACWSAIQRVRRGGVAAAESAPAV